MSEDPTKFAFKRKLSIINNRDNSNSIAVVFSRLHELPILLNNEIKGLRWKDGNISMEGDFLEKVFRLELYAIYHNKAELNDVI